MHQINYLRILLDGRLDSARAKARRNEVGASAVEWVVITALLIGIAVIVGGIILQKLRDKANSLNP